MADYEKMTVAILRGVLKDRGIPSTGLTRKAQIIEALVKNDSENEASAPPASDAPGSANEFTQDAPATDEPVQDVQSATDPLTSASEGVPMVVETEVASNSPPKPEHAAPVAPPSEDLPYSTSPVASKERPLDPIMPSVQSGLSSKSQSVDASELAEDNRKRKRRSKTPPIKAAEVEAKRLKQSPKEPIIAQAKSDASEEMQLDAEPTATERPSVAEKNNGTVANPETAKPSMQQEESSSRLDKEGSSGPVETAVPASQIRRKQSEVRDKRYQALVQPDAPTTTDTAQDEDDESLPSASPALHPATSAIYVRNFQRPLREEQLKERLEQLASSNTDGQTQVKTCYLDPMRTHAFALFESITAASRVRSALHDRVWPAERDRKSLWVDFAPEESVLRWIETEKSGGVGSRAGGKRWEVVYQTSSGDDAPVARHQEVGAPVASQPRPPVQQDAPRTHSPQSQRKEYVSQQSRPQPQAPTQPASTQKTFATLDTLFKSTSTTKPRLYYLPVSTDLAERRLREISGLTKKNWSESERRPNDELKRYTFQDDDVLVDGGAHFMSKRQMVKEGITSTGGGGPPRGGRRGGGRFGGGHGGERRRPIDHDDPYAGGRRREDNYRPR